MAALYWGEGSKKRCELINSDGKIIQLYLLALREVLNISDNDINPTLRIFSGMSRSACIRYWSKITKILSYRFAIRFNDGGTRGRTQYGMCRIGVKKGGNALKIIQSLIYQTFGNIMEKYK